MASFATSRTTLGTAVAALIAGLLLGPGHYVQATLFSGAPVAEREVYRRAAASSEPGLGASEVAPFAVDLDPGMNPLLVVAKLRIAPAPSTARRRSRLEVALREVAPQPAPAAEEQVITVWRDSVSVLRNRDAPRSESRSEGELAGPTSDIEVLPVRSFEVSTAGRYAFSVALPEPQEVEIVEVALQLRRNVREPSLPLLGAGAVCVLLGGVGLILSRRRRWRGA